MRFDASEIVAYTSGEIVAGSAEGVVATGLTWDSRTASAGCLYVAIKGERVDGHRFIAPAIAAGATVVLVTCDPADDAVVAAQQHGACIIKVADATGAITDLARAWRLRLSGRVIGLTGSVGKTTTKNMVRDVLAAAFSVVATEKNQNNELGVPNTVLNAHADTQAIVVEMGMRGLGQIESLCSFVRPDWGIVTNVGDCHIELLGSRDNVARAKSELPAALPEGGLAFLNAGGDYYDFIKKQSLLSERGVGCVSFDGTPEAASRGWDVSADAVVWATDINLNVLGQPQFTLHVRNVPGHKDESAPCALKMRGVHNVSNAAAAAAVGCAMGMSLDTVANALERCMPESGRGEVLTAPNGLTVINDAYNANPESMCASLNMFASMEVAGKRVAVLGDMGELGSASESGHERVGSLAGTLPIDLLVCVGELSRGIACAARAAGMDADCVKEVLTVDEALRLVQNSTGPKDAVLVKASHSMGLDAIAESLVK